jgi:hypothetical protein
MMLVVSSNTDTAMRLAKPCPFFVFCNDLYVFYCWLLPPGGATWPETAAASQVPRAAVAPAGSSRARMASRAAASALLLREQPGQVSMRNEYASWSGCSNRQRRTTVSQRQCF